MRFRALIAAAGAVTAVACAARTSPAPTADLLRASALVSQGCYDCLLEAREVYERLAGSGRVASAALRLFEVHLLIALREKELALEPSGSLERARGLLPRLPANADAARYLELVGVVPPDEAGTSKKALGEYLTVLLRPQFRPQALGWVRQGGIDPVVREYIAIAVDCGRTVLTGRDAPAASLDAPLLTFRRAICPATPDAPALETLRAQVPAFVESGLFLARATLVDRRGTASGSVTSKSTSAARGFLLEAVARFPRSPAMTYELGRVAQIEGDLRRAAEHYAETLTLHPEHEDARLGRAMASTYLNQTDQAISDATALVESGAYNRGEAFYWRAFNRHREKALDQARADVDQAKGLALSSRVLTLAGMIEHDQGELATAAADLTEAKRLDADNCAAYWYLGVVKHAGEAWIESGAAFADAARCYDASAHRSERFREEMVTRSDVDEAFRARHLAGFEAAIAEDRTQESAAALNAAIGYARGGDRGAAETFLDQAAKDPARRLMVADLRQVMKGP